METIRKRGKGYQIDYFDPNGKRIRKSFKKKKDAQAELGKRVSLIAEGHYLDVKKDYRTTLKELFDKYVENFQRQASYKTGKKYHIEHIRNGFIKGQRLMNCNELCEIVKVKCTQGAPKPVEVAGLFLGIGKPSNPG